MRELKRLAAPASVQQRAVRQETVSVRDSVASQRDTLRELLMRLTAISEGRPQRNSIRWQNCSLRPWSLNNMWST